MTHQATERPNILFILADDLGWGDVSYHGSPIRTPSIDRLASTGVELDCHYVCPLCTPTRASLLTGCHAGRFGRHATTPSNAPVLPDDTYTLPRMLKDTGYATALFGKWHLGSDPTFFPGRYGFDVSYGSLAGGVDPYSHRYKEGAYSRSWHRNGNLVEESGHATDLITDEAVAWIEQQTTPWFCYVPFTAVHTPVRAPEAWIDRYQDQIYDKDPARDRSFKTYAGYASHMDFCVGKLIETLKCLDQIQNTIVVFASDNGAVTTNPSADTAKYPGWHEDMPRTGCNDPLRGHKAQLYEGGIRTPAVVSWPGKLPAGKNSAPLHIVDWMPTFAGLLGCDVPADVAWDGQNVWPCLTGGQDAPERTLYWNLRHNRFAVRSNGWKLIHRPQSGAAEYELFHIGSDPHESHEISRQHPDVVAELKAHIDREHARDDRAKRHDVE